MNLVERYLQAVKMWLPARSRDDIVAELREEIRSDIEAREAERGRALTDDEVAEVVKRYGRPLVAAGRYRTQGTLIGPAFYPIYLLVLRLSLIPFLMLWTGRFVYTLVTSRLGGSPVAWIGHLSGRFWTSAVVLFGIVTLAFAVLDRIQSRSGFLDRWDPRRDLSHIPSSERTPRSSSITEFALQIAFALWWCRPASLIHVQTAGAYTWSPGATWARAHGEFFWPILILALVMAALSFAQFLHPRETMFRSLLRAGSHWAAAFIAVILVVRGWSEASAEWSWLKNAPHAASAAQFPGVVTDVLVYLTVASIAIGASIAFGVEVARIVRRRRGSGTGVKAAPQAEVLCI